jgi:ribosomal protein S18 acetylase RimI-like enzyme
MMLHVQDGNEQALNFYKKHDFVVKEKLMDYYQDLDPPHCYILTKEI